LREGAGGCPRPNAARTRDAVQGRPRDEASERRPPQHPAPSGRILYATQGATDPPTFTLFTNRPLPPTYLRYLERKIREHFEFGPTPLKLRVRQRSG
jgi:GTP-binding protein